MGMGQDAEIRIFCNYEQPGGIERASLRLRDFLDRQGYDAGLVSAGGDRIFGETTERLGSDNLSGRRVIFSRKGDLRDMRGKARGVRLIYWRHVPVARTALKRLQDILFLAWVGRRGQVVCVCDELSAEITALPFVRETRVFTCYAPLDPDLPDRVAIREPAGTGPLKIAYFGRDSAQKRLDAVLWQITQARARGAEVEVTVYGYDTVPPGADAAGVRFAGVTDDPLAALRAADTVLVLSRYEGFPTIMVEAARTGTPIIANGFRTGRTDFERLIGPVADLDPDDPDGLIRALEDLPKGHYDLSALSDEALALDWLRVIDGAG